MDMSQVANVVIPPLDQAFSYLIPAGMSDRVKIGTCVEVPFGKRRSSAFVVQVDLLENYNELKQGNFELKELYPDTDCHACFSESELKLYRWVAEYYGAPLSTVIDVAIPSQAPRKLERWISLLPGEHNLKASSQKLIVEELTKQNGPISFHELSRRVKNCGPAIKRLQELNVVSVSESEILDTHRSAVSTADWAKRAVTLTAEQSGSLEQIRTALAKESGSPILLHGVTGSGKTEVYIEIIKDLLAQDKGALIIVPEIALTPQLIERFVARLGDQVAVLHSALNKRARWDAWRGLLEGRLKVAIGARSGVFAPVKNLGLIVVDEEHDGSYKQSDGLRYNARDVAVKRAQIEKCSVILGTATPALESFHNALSKRYVYISLPSRHSTAAPLTFSIVDMNQKKPWDLPSPNISGELKTALETTLQAGQQAFILYNRRGFASFMQCDCCGHVIQCPNCSVTLTYHQKINSLVCHYCNLSLIPSEFCSVCQQDPKTDPEKVGRLQLRGAGTEKVFDELQELFPQYPIARLDRDIVQDPAAYKEVLDKMRNRHTQILVGTQMIAKGHDLPGVTLVGIVDSDVGLHIPDFRAAERSFQLLTQASGRAGRADLPGYVIMQTRVPEHPSLNFTINKDYSGFAKHELRLRKELAYPPYMKLLRLLATSAEAELPMQLLQQIKVLIEEKLTASGVTLNILGPTPAPIQRIKTHWRWHLLIKAPTGKDIQHVVKLIRHAKIKSSKVRLIMDRDPQDLL